jgi:hypothetical protein
VGAPQSRLPGQRHAAVLLVAALQHRIRRRQPARDDQPSARRWGDGATASPNFDVRTVTFIPRNAGTGSDFFTLNLRVSRAFHIGGDVKVEGLVEAFNLTDRVNNLTRNNSWGAGAYPTNPASTFNRITAVGDPRTFQFGVRLTF